MKPDETAEEKLLMLKEFSALLADEAELWCLKVTKREAQLQLRLRQICWIIERRVKP